jgi:CheY-like chemotaxis protein
MKTILIIEDEPEMRRNLATILRLEKYHPVAAENGRVGVEAALKERPDLILCDVMMPELDGFGVLRELRSHAATEATPFIFLTAKGEKIDIRSGMNLGRLSDKAGCESGSAGCHFIAAETRRADGGARFQSELRFGGAVGKSVRPHPAGCGNVAVAFPGKNQRRHRDHPRDQ